MMTAMGRALRGMSLLGGVGMLFIVVALWHPAPVAAATFTVTDNSDNPTDTGSLRFAVNNLAAGSNTITFAAPLTGGQTITLTSTLTLTHDVTISGPTSGAGVTVSGNHVVRVFTVNGGVTANIANLTIANGSSGGSNGGGILNSGTLTVTNSTLTGNSTSGGFGGGIANNGGTLTVTNSTLSGNFAFGTGGGGGIFNQIGATLSVTNSTLTGNSALVGSGGGIYSQGTLTVTNSTLSGNQANGGGANGGGISNLGTLTVTNSTLTGNSAQVGGGGIANFGGLAVTNSTLTGNSALLGSGGGGGGILNDGLLTVTNSTLSGNQANNSGANGGGIYNLNVGELTVTNSTLTGNSTSGGFGGGIYNQIGGGGTAQLGNTIVAGNTSANGPDLNGGFVSNGHNLIGTAASSTGIANGMSGDIVSATPHLGALANNGGPTQTIGLLAASPAIAAGDPAICASTTTPPAAPVGGKDQRGLTRRTDRCSIGAAEADPFVVFTPSSGSTAGGNTVRIAGWFASAGVQVTFGGVAATNVTVVDGTTLVCTAPGQGAGAVDVAIVNTNGLNLTLAGAYTYGTVNALPQQRPTGGVDGLPGSLPNPRPVGSGASGGPPAPLPNPRP